MQALADASGRASTLLRGSTSLVGIATLLLGVWVVLGPTRISGSSSARQVEVLVFKSGNASEKNPYEHVGIYLFEALHQALGDRVVRADTVGAFDSLIRLDQSAARSRREDESTQRPSSALAVTQADVVYHYVEGGHPQFLQPRPGSAVRSVAKLFRERLELRAPLSMGDPLAISADRGESKLLRLPEICGGEEGSGTRVTVLNALRVLQASWKEVLTCSADEQATRLTARGVGFSADSVPPTDSRLFGLTSASARVLMNSVRERVYEPVPLQPGAPLYTIAWPALLVADRDLDDEAVDAVLRALRALDTACSDPSTLALYGPGREAAEKLLRETDYCARGDDWRGDQAKDRSMPISLHPRLMLERLGWWSRQVVRLTEPMSLKVVLLLLLGACILLSLFPGLDSAVREGRKGGVAYRISAFVVGTHMQWVSMLLIGLVFHLGIGVLVWLSELHAHALASDVDFVSGGLQRATSWMWTFVVLGSSNIELQSNLALFWVGVLKAGWAIASSALLVALLHSLGQAWRIVRMTQYALVIGWNARGPTVVAELRRNGIEARCFGADADAPAAATSLDRAEFDADGRPVQRDPAAALEHFLTSRGLLYAEGVIVLGDTRQAGADPAALDLWVARQVCTVRSVLDRELGRVSKRAGLQDASPTVRIVAEVEQDANVELVRKLGADEAVCVRSFGIELLAQAMSKPGICELFVDLLRTEKRTHELYFEKLSAEQVSHFRTFERAARILATHSRSHIPIGIYKRSKNGSRRRLMNPRGEDGLLHAGDELICLAQKL